LLRCAYPYDRWEIIIADGMSTDNTREEITRVADGSPVSICVVDNPRRITPIALNLALIRARGDVIIRVDAHAEYGEDYVTRCVRVLDEQRADNVGGPVITLPGADTPMARAIALATAHPFGVGNSHFRTMREAREVDTVPFGCFRLRVFQQVGLFDERLARNQDYELNGRIRQAGGRIFLDPRLESTYYNRPSLRALLRQAWANGFWNAMTHYLHPYSLCLRHELPVAFALGAVLAVLSALWAIIAPLPPVLQWVAPVLWGAYLLYVLLDVLVATSLAARGGLRLWPALLAVFPSFHFVYGAGIAWGWTCALLHRHPWRKGEGIPSWHERRQELAGDAGDEVIGLVAKTHEITVRESVAE
ncbi:MAG TPA: glycosyltransferase family 2 protein, partial [Armatimonadota bacterium]